MKVTIIVRGGCVTAVYAPAGTDIELIDFDNPSRDTVQPDGDHCPQDILDQIAKVIRTVETQG
ncbi:MAG: hypothetical protein GXY55_14865 [Phycisphaerae bacterium]|mgnify:FL=1|nr:hypothetical protein [Phycisphaerae bacterium]